MNTFKNNKNLVNKLCPVEHGQTQRYDRTVYELDAFVFNLLYDMSIVMLFQDRFVMTQQTII